MTTTYCTDAKIKGIFGTANADAWADLDNDGNSSSKTARYDAARVASYNRINSLFRQTHYRIPFTGTVPDEIQQLEAELAGVAMASARGFEDNGPKLDPWTAKSEKTIAGILSGDIRLDAP